MNTKLLKPNTVKSVEGGLAPIDSTPLQETVEWKLLGVLIYGLFIYVFFIMEGSCDEECKEEVRVEMEEQKGKDLMKEYGEWLQTGEIGG